MIISIHQPHFFPWFGYFDKIINSDVFVLYDDVQFEKNYFQNRTLIKNLKGEKHWFGIQVQKASLSTNINDIMIASVFKPSSVLDMLSQNYRKAPYFKDYFSSISDILLDNNISLCDVNYKSLKFILKLLEVNTQIIVSSDLEIVADEPNRKIVEICNKLNANTYLAGQGGKNYMDQELFRQNNINIIWQDFDPNTITYEQINGEFIAGLSIIDALFNIGHVEIKRKLNE
jgi:hypothetical protein